MISISKIYVLMGGDGIELYSACRQAANRDVAIVEGVQQFIADKHTVAQKRFRPDKPIIVPDGPPDPVTGAIKYKTDFARVSRAPIAMQRYIISQKASFARGNGVTLAPSEPDTRAFEEVKRNWDENKLDFVLKEIAERQMGETQVAVIFYGEQGAERVEDFRFRNKIVSPMLGDKLEPIFDEDTGDMIAFGREYRRGEETRYDLYVMSESGNVEIRRFVNGKPRMVMGTVWMPGLDGELEEIPGEVAEVIQTPYTKLPVIYWDQIAPECHDTRALIEEFEWGFNDFLTQMGYSADPILFGKGTALDMPAKGNAGKFITTSDPDGDLKFVTPENATEARELQFRMLRDFIFTLNRSVWLSLETMKELGSATSGAALERYLIDAYMEATDKQQGSWGMGVQRMANWLTHEWKSLLGDDSSVRITVVFSRYSMQDEAERVALAMQANGGLAVVDQKASVGLAGLTDDVEGTYDAIIGQVNPASLTS